MGYDTSSWDERTRAIAEADGEAAAIDDLTERLAVARRGAGGVAGMSQQDIWRTTEPTFIRHELEERLTELTDDGWTVLTVVFDPGPGPDGGFTAIAYKWRQE